MVQIVINFDETTGKIAVASSQLPNKLLMFGIIELAKDAIREQKPSNIIMPQGPAGPVPLPARGPHSKNGD